MARETAEQALELHKFIKDTLWAELNPHYPIQQWSGPIEVQQTLLRHGFDVDLETVVEALLRLYRERHLVIGTFKYMDRNGCEYCELTFERTFISS